MRGLGKICNGSNPSPAAKKKSLNPNGFRDFSCNINGYKAFSLVKFTSDLRYVRVKFCKLQEKLLTKLLTDLLLTGADLRFRGKRSEVVVDFFIGKLFIAGKKMLVDILERVFVGPAASGHRQFCGNANREHNGGVGMPQSVDAHKWNAVPIAKDLKTVVNVVRIEGGYSTLLFRFRRLYGP